MKIRNLNSYLQNSHSVCGKILSYSIIACLFATLTIWVGGVDAADSFGDPFDGGKLKNPNWKWQNEPPNWDIDKTRKGFLYIDSEPNRNIWQGDASHFLYQETDTDMFDVETRFFARWETNSAVNGLLVKSPGDNNWVTIKFWSRDAGPKGQIQYQKRQAGMGPGDVHWKEEFGDFGDVELSLRLKKEGDKYTAWYKTAKDEDWVDIGVGNFKLNPPLWLGIYAGVAAGAGKLEVEYEYFRDNMNPFPVEPGGKATTTWGAVKTRY
ncbi:MAG: hypothetical protein OXU23_15650 [Candidatus Poribacteria bacterium]|nr:hypothetical protein [Candidatus Poribacteria bacterium]